MRVRAILVGLVLVAASLSGCLGMGDDDADAEPADTDTTDQPETNTTNETTEPEDTGPTINVTYYNTTVQGNNIPGLGEYCGPDCSQHQWSFDVPNGTGDILIEAYWNVSSEMRLGANAPGDDCESNTAMSDCEPKDEIGPSPLVIDPSEVPGGEWSIEVWPRNSPDQPVDVTVVVSTISEGSLPNGYTKAPR